MVRRFAGRDRLVIRDLGCGTGSLGRWLSPLLPNPQHWIMQDREPDLLRHVYMDVTSTALVTVETRLGDLGGVTAADLAGTSLVTASALLDILTTEEVDRLAAACADARVPALFTLSVLGEVELSPADPLDAEIAEAFNEHQRRVQDGRRLLGPDAPAAVVESFEKRGVAVQVAPSPWQLGGDHPELTAEWLRGWVGAAVEQRPELAAEAASYLRQRLDAIEEGRLSGTVGHVDVLAVPA
ncbi:hypothetical protein BCF44_110378 [Kutzneria buriramensis]|uniref:Methyltransferase family protein n=1 Tax=Kutzneria buriramensis TaxID=1045776 RepID=A0A3E0HDK7_9PSEU|nr:hypothetical protein BCF44_110378 [Kutzneria buriramensis]